MAFIFTFMFYILPTKRGLGVEIWGTYNDLRNLYDVISKFWDQERLTGHEMDGNDSIISGVLYEIRKAHDGRRLKRERDHFRQTELPYFGTRVSWVHLLFFMHAVRYNMRIVESDKFDLSILLQLEYWIERAMDSYDEIGARELKPYISNGIDRSNPDLFQYLLYINADYFEQGGGKTAFRNLPKLLRQAVLGTEEYKSFNIYLKAQAQKLQCNVSELAPNDDHIDYDGMKW